jgi:hypothetical protein
MCQGVLEHISICVLVKSLVTIGSTDTVPSRFIITTGPAGRFGPSILFLLRVYLLSTLG